MINVIQDVISYSDEQILAAARGHLRARRWQAAESVALRWLERNPGNGDAVALRGLVALINGYTEAARELIEAAVSMAPYSGFAALALAQVYLAQDDAEAVEPCLRRALVLAPAEGEASCLLASHLKSKGDFAAAETVLRSALQQVSCGALVYFSLAEFLLQEGRAGEAMAVLDQGQAIDQKAALGWLLRGLVLAALGQWHAARAACEQALLLDPENPAYLVELARILLQGAAGQGAGSSLLTEAERDIRRALVLQPKNTEASLLLGTVLRAQRRLDEALVVQAQLVRAAPEDAQAVLEIALTQRVAGKPAAALVAIERALSLVPTSLQAQGLYADFLLLSGAWAHGFAALDALDALLRSSQRRLPGPLSAESVGGRKVLLVAPVLAQALLFARYVPLLVQLGARVSMAVAPQAHGVLRGVPGLQTLLPLNTPQPAADVAVEPVFRLPVLVGGDLAKIVDALPYCLPDAADVCALRAAFAAQPAWRVGVDLGTLPNVALARALAAVLRPVGASVVFIGEMLEAGSAELMSCFAGMATESGEAADCAQLAVLLTALDALVMVDGFSAHLAGAAGVPGYVLLHGEHDGIWGGGKLSPWYPTLCLLRETASGSWAEALTELAGLLAATPSRAAVKEMA